MSRQFSVLLLYPDYIADTYGQETYYAHVEAENPREAVKAAQAEAAKANPVYFDGENPGDPEDCYPLLCLNGHQYGLNWMGHVFNTSTRRCLYCNMHEADPGATGCCDYSMSSQTPPADGNR